MPTGSTRKKNRKVLRTADHKAQALAGYGCMRGTFERLVPEDRARGAAAKAWGTLREWDEAHER